MTLPSTVKRELRIIIIMSSLKEGRSEMPRVQTARGGAEMLRMAVLSE
jgi:hypothetical protein